MNSNELKEPNETDILSLQKEIYKLSKELMRLKRHIQAGSRHKFLMDEEAQLQKRQQYLDQVTELNALIDLLKKYEKCSQDKKKGILTKIEDFLSPPKGIHGMEQNGYEKMKKKTEKLLQMYSS